MTEDQRQHPHTASETVVLSELAEELLADVEDRPAGRNASTIHMGASLRAVVVALKDGAELAEHDPPAGATLQVLRGAVTLHAAGRDWQIAPGELVPIPQRRHSVTAQADSVFLLTVALR